MRRAFTTRRLRWALPGGVAAAIAIGSLTSTVASSAAAEPNLPTKTAAQLLAALEQARPPGLSGTVVETADLGLPQLPNFVTPGGGSDLSLANLITGAHTVRVWYAGQQQQRLAVLGQMSETDIIHNGTQLWSYSSTTREVTHSTVADGEGLPTPADITANMTPQAAADAALKAIDPTTTVQVDNTARVAGRAAYQLLLSPKDNRSLIGSVRIAIDAQTSVPLRVQLFAHGATSPAIQVGFTDVSFKTPDASVFQFVPPAGSTVVEGNPFSTAGPGGRGAIVKRGTATYGQATPAPGAVGTGSDNRLSVLGKGWTAVVETYSGSLDTSGSRGNGNGPESAAAAILNQIATPVKGGRLVTSSLFSIFIADGGHVFVGPVSADAIQQVAATGRGL
jgi:outer membrane lipoprotein-sorting protein